MVCEDVNFAAKRAECTPKMCRAMMICEDPNILDGDGGGQLLALPNLGELIDIDDVEGRLQDCDSLFCLPASIQFTSVAPIEMQPIWHHQPLSPKELVPPSRVGWESTDGQRVPRLVRRGVGGLGQQQTCGNTHCSTTFTGKPKCLFKWAASIPESSIYADMPCLMCDQMRAIGTKLYSGGGHSRYGSEYDESSIASSPGMPYKESCVHCMQCHCQLANCLQWRLLQGCEGMPML